jgi:hypothetical protein
LNEEDLKVVWNCDDCGLNFFFYSDALDHRKLKRHARVTKYDIHSGRPVTEPSK